MYVYESVEMLECMCTYVLCVYACLCGLYLFMCVCVFLRLCAVCVYLSVCICVFMCMVCVFVWVYVRCVFMWVCSVCLCESLCVCVFECTGHETDYMSRKLEATALHWTYRKAIVLSPLRCSTGLSRICLEWSALNFLSILSRFPSENGSFRSLRLYIHNLAFIQNGRIHPRTLLPARCVLSLVSAVRRCKAIGFHIVKRNGKND